MQLNLLHNIKTCYVLICFILHLHVYLFSFQRQPITMQSSAVDPKLAGWLSNENALRERPAKKLTRPPESYVALIAKAIISVGSGRALLSDIYNYSTDNYEYYRNAPKTWKNAIRHNLSVNDCFVKNGRAPHGRGYYWSVHPACLQSFLSGDFRRKEALQLVNSSDRKQEIQLRHVPLGPQHYLAHQHHRQQHLYQQQGPQMTQQHRCPMGYQPMSYSDCYV